MRDKTKYAHGGETKPFFIGCKVTWGMYQDVHRVADASGMDVSDVIRWALYRSIRLPLSAMSDNAIKRPRKK